MSDLAFNEFIISATPLARTTTRDTENVVGESIEIAETSSWEIVFL
jgi:hypothetical protein